jgi:hypothetical protein
VCFGRCVRSEPYTTMRRAKGDDFPYKSGYGHSGKRGGAELEQYRRQGHAAAEAAWRQDPAHGINFISKRMGLDPMKVAQHYINSQSNQDWANQSNLNLNPAHPSRKESDFAVLKSQWNNIAT